MLLIRRFYALPEEEKGCNAIHLLHLDLMTLTIEAQPGNVDGHTDPTLPIDPEALFVPDLDVRLQHETVADPAHFAAWFAAAQAGGQFGAEDSEIQQFVSGLLKYLWLQKKDRLV